MKVPSAIIHINQSIRDGVLYLSSDDLPGLWLWGKDHEQVFRGIIPTIAKLYELNEGRTVEIKEAPIVEATARWFGRTRICDTFEVYDVNNKQSENVTHGQTTMD
jgi:hypothetical protein